MLPFVQGASSSQPKFPTAFLRNIYKGSNHKSKSIASMAFSQFISLTIAMILFSAQLSDVRGGSTPPKSKKTDGAWQCELHAPEIRKPKDVTDEYLRDLYSKCKPGASDAELREAYEYLHELQKEEEEEEKTARALSGVSVNGTFDMNAVSRGAVFEKHGKSYGTKDVKTNEPYVGGEWYFKFYQDQDKGVITGATFPNSRVLASGCAKACRWKLFFICIGSYIESNIKVQSTDTLCYKWLFWTRCQSRDHRVYYRYWDTNPTTKGSCRCDTECTGCTAD